jgi:hypothetical protein
MDELPLDRREEGEEEQEMGDGEVLSTEVGEVGTSESIPEPGSWRKPTMEEKEEMIRS